MNTNKQPNAWLVVKPEVPIDFPYPEYCVALPGEITKYQAIREDDWILIINKTSDAIAVGRVYRIRSSLENTIFYFDKFLAFDAPCSLFGSSISAGSSNVNRLAWSDFIESLPKVSGNTIADIPRIGASHDTHEVAYIRELLQLAVMDDLLGPANGPREEIVDMSVRDRYLVGKLAPRNSKKDEGIESLSGALANDASDEPEEVVETIDKKAPSRLSHDPGAEFNSTTGKVEADADSGDEIEAASNQSLIPSSVGITFCVTGDVEAIEVEALWGRYERFKDHEHLKIINKKIKDA